MRMNDAGIGYAMFLLLWPILIFIALSSFSSPLSKKTTCAESIGDMFLEMSLHDGDVEKLHANTKRMYNVLWEMFLYLKLVEDSNDEVDAKEMTRNFSEIIKRVEDIFPSKEKITK